MGTLGNSVKQYRTSLFLAQLIFQLRQQGGTQNIINAVTQDTTKQTLVGFQPGTDAAPALCWVQSGDFAIILGDGLMSAGQAAGVTAGYIGGPFDSIADPINAYAVNMADILDTFVPPAVFNGAKTVYLAGWSLGGLAIESWAARLASGNILNRVEWCTFGAPRMSGPTLALLPGNFTGVRWMNDEDPVPLALLRVADLPILPLLVGINPARRFGNFVHPKGGVVLGPGGSVTDAELPSAAAISWSTSFAGWLLQQDGPGGNMHYILSYATRLGNLMLATASQTSEPRAEAPRESPENTSRATVTAAQQLLLKPLNDLGTAQEEQPPQSDASKAFRAYRDGRVWFVAFGDQTIAVGPRKKRARGLARVGNELLDRLGRQAMVDPDTIINQITAYLRVAGDPTSSVIPHINSVPPVVGT